MIVVFVKGGGFYFVRLKEFSGISEEYLYVIGKVEKSVDTGIYLTGQEVGFYVSINGGESQIAL